MGYGVNLLSFDWWVGSLFGNIYIAIMLIELFVLISVRKIVNITSIAFLIVLINSVFLLYGLFTGTAYILPAAVMGIITVVIAIIIARNF